MDGVGEQHQREHQKHRDNIRGSSLGRLLKKHPKNFGSSKYMRFPQNGDGLPDELTMIPDYLVLGIKPSI